jgi:nucleoid-associated protein YgaU
VSGKEDVDPAGIVKSITDHGFEVKNLDLSVDKDVASVAGTASNQADREKIVVLVGNTKGIAQVNDRMTVPPPEPQAPAELPSTFYEVKSDDTLGKIAKTHYGNAMKYPLIFEANRPMLKDPDRIYPGQVLRIPPE